MPEPLVSISLLTYNGEKYIKDCLISVFNQTYPNLEIIVIDNGSTDKTLKIVSDFVEVPKIKIIANKKNLGFAAGHNIGIKESKGEFILCLNQDVILDKGFIQKAVEIFKKDAKIGAVQGKLLNWESGTGNQELGIIDTTGLVILKNRQVINRGQGKMDVGQYNKEEEIFGADGAAPIYRKKALEDIKIPVPSSQFPVPNYEYFDEDFFVYKEDVDLSWRLRLAGWEIVYSPQVIAWHERKSKVKSQKSKLILFNIFNILKSRRGQSDFVQYYSFKNQRLMQIKNEQLWLLIKHLPWWLSKEIALWIYAILFEHCTWRAIKDLFHQTPRAWQKRKIIMKNKKIGIKEIKKWFQ